MDPEQTDLPATPPASQQTPPQPISSNQATNPAGQYGEPLITSEMTDKLTGLVTNPKVSKYLGKATKVVIACAVSGCILLTVAILAVVNLLNSVTSAIHP